MKLRSPLVLLLAAAGAGWLLLLLIEASATVGGYPEYSSLRADGVGTKVLYESLERIPGVQVERSFVPWRVYRSQGTLVLLAGMSPLRLFFMSDAELKEMEQAAERGNRVVVAVAPTERRKDPIESNTAPIARRWGVRVRLPARPDETVTLTADSRWKVMETGTMLERSFGKGSLVLVSDCGWLRNAHQARHRTGDRLARLLAGYRRIVFEESHLGMVDGGSVVKLALRYRMHGFLAGFLLWVALYVWKNASAFPPRRVVERPAVAGRTSFSGLVTLLRRNVPERELPRVAFAAWRKTAERMYSRAEMDRAAAVLEAPAAPAAVILDRVRAELPRRGKGAA